MKDVRCRFMQEWQGRSRRKFLEYARGSDPRALDQGLIRLAALRWANPGRFVAGAKALRTADAVLEEGGVTFGGDRALYLLYEREVRHAGLAIQERRVTG